MAKGKSESIENRNAIIRARLAGGEKAQDLAKEFKLSIRQMSRVLNDKAAREETKLGVNMLTTLMDASIEAIQDALNDIDIKVRLTAACKVLKSLGILREHVDVQQHTPKPLVIEARNGKKIIMGVPGADLVDNALENGGVITGGKIEKKEKEN